MDETHHPGQAQLLNYSHDLDLEECIRAHIDRCDHCQRLISDLRQERMSLSETLQPEIKLKAYLHRSAGRRPGLRLSMRWALAGLATAVALFCIWWLPSQERGQVRLKGTVTFQVYVNKEGKAVPVSGSHRFRKGDRVRLGISSPTAARITVMVGNQGDFVEIPELSAVPVPAGEEVVLPGSLELDCDGPSETVRIRVESADGASRPVPEKTLVFRCEQP